MPQSLPLFLGRKPTPSPSSSPSRGRPMWQPEMWRMLCTCCRTLRQFSVSEAAAATAAARRKLHSFMQHPSLQPPASSLQMQLQLQLLACYWWSGLFLCVGQVRCSFGAHFTFCDGCSNRCPLSVAINYATGRTENESAQRKKFPKRKKQKRQQTCLQPAKFMPQCVRSALSFPATPIISQRPPSENIVARSSLSSNAIAVSRQRCHLARRLIKTFSLRYCRPDQSRPGPDLFPLVRWVYDWIRR